MVENKVFNKKQKKKKLKSIINEKFKPDERLEVWMQIQTAINSKK